MVNSTMTELRTTEAATARLEMRWLPVTDQRGRTRMQACWIESGRTTSASAAHHAA